MKIENVRNRMTAGSDFFVEKKIAYQIDRKVERFIINNCCNKLPDVKWEMIVVISNFPYNLL